MDEFGVQFSGTFKFYKAKGYISRSLTTRSAMIPIEGLSGLLWISVKPLTYSKPIIGNGIDCELVG